MKSNSNKNDSDSDEDIVIHSNKAFKRQTVSNKSSKNSRSLFVKISFIYLFFFSLNILNSSIQTPIA